MWDSPENFPRSSRGADRHPYFYNRERSTLSGNNLHFLSSQTAPDYRREIPFRHKLNRVSCDRISLT